MAIQSRLIGPWRRLFQWGITLLIIGIPFIRINGKSLFRVDLPSLSLHLGSLTYSIEELYIFALFCIMLLFFFLLATLVLGRVWCGWACPQTSLVDLFDGFAALIGIRVTPGSLLTRSPLQKLLLHSFALLLGLLVGANLVWYFISPYDFFPALLSGSLGPWPTGIVITFAILVYIDLVFVRRLLCREFCPYGRFQTVLVDPGTLTLRYFDDQDERCIHCEACVRVCPQGIDIKKGFQVECINCAKCLDACRKVMAKKGQPGLIGYTFGTAGKGWLALLNPRMLFIATIFLILSLILIFAAANRALVSIKLSRIPLMKVRQLPDGFYAIPFTAFVVNLSGKEEHVSLTAADENGKAIRIQGPVEKISLAEEEKKQFNFAIVVPRLDPEQQQPVIIAVLTPEGTIVAKSRILLPKQQKERGSADEK